jgi:hypothetical protein
MATYTVWVQLAPDLDVNGAARERELKITGKNREDILNRARGKAADDTDHYLNALYDPKDKQRLWGQGQGWLDIAYERIPE